MSIRATLFLGLVTVQTASACTYCNPANLKIQTFREEARTSKVVVIGHLANARLVGDKGSTDLVIEQIIKDDPARGKSTTITLPRWTPVDPKKPPRLLVFFDVYDGKLDPFRGVTVRGNGVGNYLAAALKLDDRDRTTSLLYYFRHLDSSDSEVAADAFIEFAKATDQDVGAVGPKLEPAKLRKLLTDPKTPAERLGLFAFLLGACGDKSDADMLEEILAKSDERSSAALSGVLGGLIEIRPESGWKKVVELLENEKRPYQDKLAVLGTLRFFHAYKPKDYRKPILAGMSAVVARGDMADMAIEDLRRWKEWDLTKQILEQYTKPTHAAPLVKNAILRYALCCPDAEAVAFVKWARSKDPAAVKEIEESIAFERPTPVKKP